MNKDINQAVGLIKAGKAVIYPTETFFALGGMGTDKDVVRKIQAIKKRPGHKPLPLVAGSVLQCLEVVEMDDLSASLAEDFWPAPLSILLRARNIIPYGVKDPEGLVSIRVTPHPDAAELCLNAGVALIATSANYSSEPSMASYAGLNKKLAAEVSYVLNSRQSPAGGLPSTLVKVAGVKKLTILRPGKVSAGQITEKGWTVLS